MANIYDMSDTWNSGATVFTAVKMNVTDTASNAGSLLADFQVGGASKFSVSKAGDILSNGAAVYKAAGTDVALADGGTGASLSDPNADRIMFWDDSAGGMTWLSPGTGLSISGTDLNASSSAPTWTQIATRTPTPGGTSAVQFTSIPTTYADLLVTFENVSLALSGSISIYAATQAAPSTFSGSASLTVAGGWATGNSGAMFIPNYLGTHGAGYWGAAAGTSPNFTDGGSTNYGFRVTGGIGGLQFIPSQNWSAGTIRVLGR